MQFPGPPGNINTDRTYRNGKSKWVSPKYDCFNGFSAKQTTYGIFHGKGVHAFPAQTLQPAPCMCIAADMARVSKGDNIFWFPKIAAAMFNGAGHPASFSSWILKQFCTKL